MVGVTVGVNALDNVDVPMWTSWTTWTMLGNPTVTVLLLFLLSWKHFRNKNGGKTALLRDVCGPLPKINSLGPNSRASLTFRQKWTQVSSFLAQSKVKTAESGMDDCSRDR